MRAHRPPHRSAATRPRRRHPARVYRVRQLLALTLLAAVVVGVLGLGRLLTGLSDGQSGDDRATTTSAESAETPTDPTQTGGAEAGSTDTASPTPGAARSGSPSADPSPSATTPKPPPATPDGPCAEEDVVVTPSVKKAVGGSPITIRLDLTTIESEACRWDVSPETLALRITSGKDEIWSSRQCPAALPETSVVVRQERRRRLRVEWSARRSDEECSALSEWALPGYYHVQSAALAGEPRDAQFEVTAPKRPLVTRSAGPRSKQSNRERNRQR